MDDQRLQQILNSFPKINLIVIGDYFLDSYLILEKNLSEISLETGLEAFQVVEMRKSPGAAGTVAANLRALNVNVTAIGITGEDGNGYELRNKLKEMKVDIHALVQCPERFTPTYHKPMMREANGREHELNRMDIKNRRALPETVEEQIIEHLRELIPQADGVLVMDQVQEQNCGVITNTIRKEIQVLAQKYPQKFFLVDSREYAGLFENVILKTNLSEAQKAAGETNQPDASTEQIFECCQKLYQKTQRPILITRGEDGSLIYEGFRKSFKAIPTFHVTGPIDIVGAGDSVSASVGSALCAGASFEEAALIGNLTASLVIQQLGTTGTTTRSRITERFKEFEAQKK